MTKLEQPELDFPEWFTRDFILPVLPEDLSDYDNLDPDNIEAARSILAQEYVEHGSLRGAVKLLIGIGIWDLLYPLPPAVYGLFLSAYGSVFLAAPALHTPETLTENTIGRAEDMEKLVRDSAEESVKTNMGIVFLLGGFVLQAIALVGLNINLVSLIGGYLSGLPGLLGLSSVELGSQDWLLGKFNSGKVFAVFYVAIDLYISGPIGRRFQALYSWMRP